MNDILHKIDRGSKVEYMDDQWEAMWGVVSPDPDARIKIQRTSGQGVTEVQVVPIIQVRQL
jgi:hypothetical protein